MKKSLLLLFSIPMFLLGCNNSNVNLPKSPFKDDYKRIGMTTEYTKSAITSIDSGEYNNLKNSIKNYSSNDKEVTNYKRTEQTRDLKAAYFGKNLGAANLCSLLTRTDTNTMYNNKVTTKLVNIHRENQVMNGPNITSNQQMDDYIYSSESNNKFRVNRLLKNDNENPVITKSDEQDIVSDTFYIQPYEKDIKNNFTIKSRSGKEISFSVLADSNSAVYGKTKIDNIGDRYIIREALSDFATYSTTVGDTYKSVDNYFYEALLDNNYKFTHFRFYHELLILSEALNDETKVPVLYLEKPQLVEFSEIKYEINYNAVGDYDRGSIPQP